MAKLSFFLGAAAGYVLGARAGRHRYEQIKGGAQQVWGSKPVQKQVETAKHTAKTKAAPAALDAVSGAAAVAGDKLRQGAGKIAGDSERDVASETVDASAATTSEPAATPAQTSTPDGPQTFPLSESGRG